MSAEIMKVNAERIRKVWHNGEWCYSVVDVIAEFLRRDYEHARWYWRTLKHRLRSEGNDLVVRCQTAKLSALDGKMRSTDVANEKVCEEIKKVVQRISFNSSKRLAQQRDEVINVHPVIASHLTSNGWIVQPHHRLPSGRTIDMLASRGGEILVVECKRELQGVYLYQAIGQTLCYTAEYGASAKPAIACLVGNIDEYALNSCQALGIIVIEAGS